MLFLLNAMSATLLVFSHKVLGPKQSSSLRMSLFRLLYALTYESFTLIVTSLRKWFSWGYQRVEYTAEPAPVNRDSSIASGEGTSSDDTSRSSGGEEGGTTARVSLYSTGSSATTSSQSSSDIHEDGGSWSSGGEAMILAEALWDHVTMEPEELEFSVGEVIQVYDWALPDYWFGATKNRSGWFPASYVRLLANQSPDDNTIPEETGETSDPLSSNRLRRLRVSVLQELLSTERDYVALLHNLVEGFLNQARRREELFPKEKLQVIFGNLEEIYDLHRVFLADLEMNLADLDADTACVGECFLRHQRTFEIYSDYCNNHPLSCDELVNLYHHQSYKHFFEACRLLRAMPELSLDAFLLTPVQRICKYPLQLAELVKSTPGSHPDAFHCRQALEAMRRVASVINDKKRRLEHLQNMAAWQRTIEAWQGPDLLESSSSFIHSGEVMVRFMVKGNVQWTKEYVAFLFSHSVVFCKKDILKRQQLIYKDQIILTDSSRWYSIPDGKDSQFGISVKYGWKLDLGDSNKRCFLFTVRGKNTKKEWEEGFREQMHKSQDPYALPPSSEEKRIARSTLKLLPTAESSLRASKRLYEMPNSRSIPGKLWMKAGGRVSK